METQLDPQIVNLTKAIRQAEGGVNVGAGASGESGAYQFMPGTWEKYSKETGVNVPLEQATLQQKNEVAYKKIKAWKDQGYNVGQIASMWNAGEERPDAYKQNWKGVNEKGVSYDTPAYAEKVATYYHQFKGQEAPGYNPKPFSQPNEQGGNVGAVDFSGLIQNPPTPPAPTPEQKDTLGYQLGERAKGLGKTWEDTASGAINPVSTGIQTFGAAAGAIGDVTNKLLENTPIVGGVLKSIEGAIGKGAQAFLNTPIGQKVAQSVSDFATKHPEISKDMGAAFNIATALPILKGLGAVKNVALDTAAKALQNRAETAVASGLENTAKSGAFKSASKLLNKDKGIYKDMISQRTIPDIEGKITTERILPDIQGGKYVTDEAKQATWDNINTLEDKIKDRISGQFAARQTGSNVYAKLANPFKVFENTVKEMPNAGLTGQDLIGTAKELDPGNKLLWDKFISGEANLSETNQLRSSLGRKIGSNTFDNPDVAFKKEVGKNLYGAMSEYVKTESPETRHLFDEITKQFNFQKALDLLNGKNIKTGFFGKAATTAAIGAGEALGSMSGIPFAGSYGAYQAEKLAAKRLGGGLNQAILKRSAQPVASNVKNKLGGLLGSALAQKASTLNR